jgi:diacylglycerol kinase (ATP)
MLRTQHNAWIHAAATLAVGVAALVLGLGATDWALIVIAVVAVWTAEALNTALECLGDATSAELNALVGQAKDVAAGAVLISSSGAVLIGILVFAPYLSALGG